MKGLHTSVKILYLFQLLYFTSSVKIQGNTQVGGPCGVSNDCVGNPGITSECRDGRCACRASFIPSSYLDDCLPIATGLGDWCSETPQCQQGVPGYFSDCFAERCQCTSEAISAQGGHICYLKALEVGDNCQVHIQCSSNLGVLSICSGTTKKCICSSGAFPSPDNRQCTQQNNNVLIGGSCTSSVQCLGNPMVNVECTASAMCACRLGFVTNIQMNDCLPIVNSLDSDCSESQQCQQGTPGNHSVCKNSTANPSHKVCKCTSDAVNQPGGSKCFTKAHNGGSSCQIQEQCIATLGQSQCIDGVCQCLEPARRSVNGVQCVVEQEKSNSYE